MTDIEALTEAQKMIIQKGSDESYPLKKAIRDIEYYCGYIRAENQITDGLEEEGA